jgi:hypothetical protein
MYVHTGMPHCRVAFHDGDACDPSGLEPHRWLFIAETLRRTSLLLFRGPAS